MDTGTAIATASMAVAVLALFVAIAQVNIQQSIEARRKGKTDKLALGAWAITCPQVRGIAFDVLGFFRIRSPFGDPAILTVPFITVGALEDCLRRGAAGEGRGALDRRMRDRLVESATQSIATGGGRFTGRMYAVRGTTRKRSEACWSDAMDMCGITRTYWPLLTGASAIACDGAIRPANAVTNLHSLWGFARAMGLRDIEISGTRITMTNGRYHILEEMSQQTAQSIYSDAVWSSGCVPSPARLVLDVVGGIPDRSSSSRRVAWPGHLNTPILALSDESDEAKYTEAKFTAWAEELVRGDVAMQGQLDARQVSFFRLLQDREPCLISCIRTFPRNELSNGQRSACAKALLWCTRHWWRDPYQTLQRTGPNGTTVIADRPELPLPSTVHISSEFVTATSQAMAWCQAVRSCKRIPVDAETWTACVRFAEAGADITRPDLLLPYGQQMSLLKILQGWKLHVFAAKIRRPGLPKNMPDPANQAVAACELLLITMATLAISSDASRMGSGEVAKALEIELG